MPKTAKKFTGYCGKIGKIGSKVIDCEDVRMDALEKVIERNPGLVETVTKIYRQGAAGTKIKVENDAGERKLVSGKYYIIIE